MTDKQQQSAPLTDTDLAAIRERFGRAIEIHPVLVLHTGVTLEQLDLKATTASAYDVPLLLAEVERLHAMLALAAADYERASGDYAHLVDQEFNASNTPTESVSAEEALADWAAQAAAALGIDPPSPTR